MVGNSHEKEIYFMRVIHTGLALLKNNYLYNYKRTENTSA